MAHILQSVTDEDPQATIVSIDGVGAFDLISRRAMLEGLLGMEGGDKILPFVRSFYDSPSTYLWEDELGTTQHVPQGEGGEQGDPLMPLLFALGQHRSLVAIQERLRGDERVFAYLDDIYAVCGPGRVEEVHMILEEELRTHAHIQVHHGKTQVWNRGGFLPNGVEELTRAARMLKPGAVVWKGDPSLPASQQGLKVLGIPVGQPAFVREFLENKSREQTVLFQRIPWVNDPQSAWLLLSMCAATRANFWLRGVRPEQTEEFADRHDANVWNCLRTILGTPRASPTAQVLSSLALSTGGLGLSSARRVRFAAHWASWADCIRMVRKRHPAIAERWIQGFVDGGVPCFDAVRTCQQRLVDAGLEMPTWMELSESPPVLDADPEPSQPKVGWQQSAVRQTEHKFVHEEVLPGWDDPRRALLRSQHGPLASAPFTALPTSRVTRIDAQPFRLLMCRRLHLPLPLTLRTCRCGRQLDMYGHHRAACAEAGVLGRRGFPLEVAAAQVCREGGARVSTNVFVRDMDLAAFNALDSRRLEVVADGLTLFGGAQLAIDTTLVSPLHRDGTARRRAAHVNGAALEVARRRKERTYPELAGDQGRARLVVLAAEVGGRWNTETAQFISALAKARSTSVPEFLQARVEAAWIRRWSAILACSAARAFSLSLLDQRPVPRMCEIPSSHEVLRDDRFA